MGLRKKLQDFKGWCPQSPSRLPFKLRSYTVPIAVVLAAALISGVFLSLPSLQNVPTQPVPQLPQTPPENSTQPSPTPIPTPTETPIPTPLPTPTPTPTSPTVTQVTAVNGTFELTMSVEKTVFKVGENVNINVTLTNIGNQSVDIGVDAWLLDFIVSDSMSGLIYQNSQEGAMPQIIGNWTLQPGQNITRDYVWGQIYSGPNPGPAVSPGTYYIAGVCNFEPTLCYAFQSDPIEILIVGS